VVVERGKRLGVVRRCVDERVLQGKKGGKEEDRNMMNWMEKKKKRKKENEEQRASISK